MWGLLSVIFKNPITELLVDKTIGAINHSLELKKIERVTELECAAKIETQQVLSSERSWKDEWLTLVFTGLLLAHFIPATEPYVVKGWELLKQAPDMFWYILAGIVSGSFGINILNKFKG